MIVCNHFKFPQKQQQHQQPKPAMVKQIKEEKNKLPVKEKMTKEKMVDKLVCIFRLNPFWIICENLKCELIAIVQCI